MYKMLHSNQTTDSGEILHFRTNYLLNPDFFSAERGIPTRSENLKNGGQSYASSLPRSSMWVPPPSGTTIISTGHCLITGPSDCLPNCVELSGNISSMLAISICGCSYRASTILPHN